VDLIAIGAPRNYILNVTSKIKPESREKFSEAFNWILVGCIVVFPIFQVTALWFYDGPKVDESELVLFGVGFLGGELDPVWNHYGHLGMYLLGLLYYLIGSIAIALGKYDSLIDYAAQFTFSGYFFIIARAVMALCLMIVIALCAKMLERIAFNRWFIALSVLAVSISPTIIYYANYIRIDTLVALFTILFLFMAVRAKAFSDVLWLALVSAAAIATKISAITLAGPFGIVLCLLLYRNQITWGRAVLGGVLFLVLVQALSPFMDYVELLSTLLSSESGGVESVSRLQFIGFEARALKMFQFHSDALTLPVCLLSVFSLFGLLSRQYRKLVAYSWLLVFFTILPYWFGSTLRDYWFVPTYALVALLAVVAGAILFGETKKVMNPRLHGFAATISTVALIFGPIYLSATRYISSVEYHANSPISNRVAAERWLEQTHLGVHPILVDRHYAWVYPKLYDLAHLHVSRQISKLFIYDRSHNRFLSSVFENYLYSDYLKKGENISSMIVRMEGIRIDFSDGVSMFSAPSVCSSYSQVCDTTQIHSSNDLELVVTDEATTQVRVVGNDPYIVFKVGKPVPVDGTFNVVLDTDSESWEVRYDYGEGYDSKPIARRLKGSQLVPIRASKSIPWVRFFGTSGRLNDKYLSEDTVLFVTSDGPYGRFEHLRTKIIAPSNRNEMGGLAILRWHDEITKSTPIKVFKDNAGTTINIYNVSKYLKRKQLERAL
jgi:hypothetical protein